MTGTWIVVADSSKARIFSMKSQHEPLTEIHCMVHVASRSHAHDDLADHGNLSQGGHAHDARTDKKQHESAVFAGQIASLLEQSRAKGVYNNLILVAPPAFLGALRHAINDHVYDYISESLDKNLVTETEASIRRHLF